MKTLILLIPLFVLLNCTTLSNQRRPANADDLDLSKIDVDSLEKNYRLALEKHNQTSTPFRILNYPVTGGEDVENGSELLNMFRNMEELNELHQQFSQSLTIEDSNGNQR
ncbi:MAG: hypothetical protein MJK18_11065, partial [Bdellovibrionales bacterium]|nr:hypothetical protein [Bdellovibrionales bacterium]